MIRPSVLKGPVNGVIKRVLPKTGTVVEYAYDNKGILATKSITLGSGNNSAKERTFFACKSLFGNKMNVRGWEGAEYRQKVKEITDMLMESLK